MAVILSLFGIVVFVSLLVSHLAYQLADRWQERTWHRDRRFERDARYMRALWKK